MPAVKIPGAESIESVAPQRDPGVTATPDAFGAQIGTAEQHFGDSLGSLGALLYKKRQAAEDQTYEQTYNVNVAPELQRAQQNLQKQYPNGGPEYEQAADSAYMNVHATVKQKLAEMGLNPSESASKAVDTSFNGRFTNLRVGAVAYNNNASIQKLQTVNDNNVNALSSQVMSGALSPDAALKQFDQIAAASTQLYGGKEFDAFQKNGRATIQQAAVDKEIAAKNPDAARELNARYFGGAPRPGQSSADPLVQSESGGNPRLVNSLGFAGTYQFGAPRLEDLGVYTPGPHENLDTWNKTGKNAPGKWSGTFNIEGFPQVKTIQDFLANPAAQKEVFDEHMSDIDEEATKRGLDKYVGQSVGGVQITQASIRNMAHLGGIGGAEQFLKTGGQYNVPDANGTTLAKYAAMGSAGATNPNTGRALSNINKIDSMDAVNRKDTQDAVNDDVASMMATGKGDPTLTAERITRALGPNAAADWGTARLRAVAFHDNTQDFYALPESDIAARLEVLKPKPGQEEFIAQQKLYTMAQEKADATLVARQNDPAASVSADPQVKAAVQGGATLDDPTKLKPLVTARLAAQARAGVSPDAQSPITKSEAMTLTVPLRRMLPGQERQTLMDMGKQFQELFGSDADNAFAYALRVHKVDAATAQAAAQVMKKLGLGIVPNETDTRAQDHAAEDTAAKAATGATSVADYSNAMQSENDKLLRMQAGTEPMPTQPGASVPVKAIRDLRANNDLAGEFDKKYGAGTSKKILENYPVIK